MTQAPKNQRNTWTSQDGPEMASERSLVRVKGTGNHPHSYQQEGSALLLDMSADPVPPGLVDRMIEFVRVELSRDPVSPSE